ncbi:MAG: glycosyltransferase family 9 protein [Candidatus Edwardsbacteria bacterium]|nr:glycosyltransferase family 9 protein [Candidatus Edwardsbacteria bacterium]
MSSLISRAAALVDLLRTVRAPWRLVPGIILGIVRRRLVPQGLRAGSPPLRAARILVIKLYGLGNMVLFTPALRALRQAYPGAELTLLVDTDLALDAAAGLDLYDRSFVVPLHRFDDSLVARFRTHCYDIVIVSYPMVEERVARFAGLLRGRYKACHAFDRCQTALFEHHPPIDLARHEVLMNLDLLGPLGIAVTEPRLWFAVDGASREYAESVPGNVVRKQRGLNVVYAIGSSRAQQLKRWPAQRYRDVCDRLWRRYGATSVFLGTGDEEKEIGALIATLRGPAVNLAGKTTLHQAGAVIARAGLFIGGDTGLMHVAAAVGTPVVAIFGPTIERKNGPWCLRHRTVTAGVPCRPCYRFRIDCTHRPAYECFSAIRADDIIRVAGELIDESSR